MLLNLYLPLAAIQLKKELVMAGESCCSALSLFSFKENKYKQHSAGGGDGLDYHN